jgi:2-(1,2-epoxy-1,2-dihydrophenyl)acetyl-CoA isomerase
VATQVGLEFRDDDEVALTGLNVPVTSGADVALAGGVRLYGGDDLYPERVAHARSTTTTSRVPTTMTMSAADFCWERKGLKPMSGMVGAGIVPAMFVVTDSGSIRTLTIDNPARRNAIPADQWGALADALVAFDESDDRVLIITGSGDDFCSGLDVGSSMSEGGVSSWYRSMSELGRATRALHTTAKPTIAAVDGVAAGAGMNLALGCDILLATDRARFTEVFVKRGLTVDFGGSWLLPRRVGIARAKELALTGRIVSAAEALEYGIATRVVPNEELSAEVEALAADLAAGAPLAQRFIKAGLDRSFEMSFDEALAYEAQAQAILLTSEDAIEGLISFLEKRPPNFKGS